MMLATNKPVAELRLVLRNVKETMIVEAVRNVVLRMGAIPYALAALILILRLHIHKPLADRASSVSLGCSRTVHILLVNRCLNVFAALCLVLLDIVSTLLPVKQCAPVIRLAKQSTLYDKILENGIGSSSFIYVVLPNANSPPMPGRNYSQMALPGQNYTGQNTYSRGTPKPLPLAYGATRPVEIPKVPKMPVTSNPPAASKALPAPLRDVRPQNSYPERGL